MKIKQKLLVSDEGCPFRSAYSGRVRVALNAGATEHSPGAVQSFKAECDINGIMAKYQRTGVVNWLAKHGGRYEDVTGVTFQEAMDTIVKGREIFDDLPSSIRERFQNDPAMFLAFMHDEANTEEAIRLGLATKREPPPVVRVEVVPPATPAA